MPGFFVLRPGALGDALVALPALAALRARYPAARIVVAGHREAFELARPAVVDEVIRFDDARLGPLFGDDAGPLPAETRALFKAIDTALLWLSDGALVGQRIGTLGVRALALPPWPEDDRPGQTAESPSPGPLPSSASGRARRVEGGGAVARHLAGTLSSLGVGAIGSPLARAALRSMVPRRATAEGALTAASPAGRYCVVHPGSGGDRKRLPASTVAEVCRALDQRGLQPRLLEGPADATIVQRVLALLDRPVPVVRGLALRGVVALLAGATAYAGLDSGISHLAALAGTRTVVIFGPSDSVLWAPHGDDVWVVEAARPGCDRPCRVGASCACLERLPADEALGPILAAAS